MLYGRHCGELLLFSNGAHIIRKTVHGKQHIITLGNHLLGIDILNNTPELIFSACIVPLNLFSVSCLAI